VDLTPEEWRTARVKAAALLAALDACPVAAPASAQVKPQSPEDRLLTPEEAAGVLGVKVRWLYRHAQTLPFTVRLSRKVLRFSEVGVRRLMAKRGLAGAGTL
jgi:predicted DNA-binding transcriptional regulator AlpA